MLSGGVDFISLNRRIHLVVYTGQVSGRLNGKFILGSVFHRSLNERGQFNKEEQKNHQPEKSNIDTNPIHLLNDMC